MQSIVSGDEHDVDDDDDDDDDDGGVSSLNDLVSVSHRHDGSSTLTNRRSSPDSYELPPRHQACMLRQNTALLT